MTNSNHLLVRYKKKKNNQCVNCSSNNVQFAFIYMAAFFCKDCKEAMVATANGCKYVYYKSLQPTEIWNDFQLQILDMGGNESL